MKLEKPIFIVSCGRSGSTVLHAILSKHPNIVWLSSLCDKYPKKPSRNRFLMNTIDYPIFGKYLANKLGPDESYDFWEYHCKGFSVPCRDLRREDVTNNTKEKIRDVMAQMLTHRRNRLLVKITGWPRIGYLSEIFADARFIHILRDGRAVVNSLINVDFWWGWKGPQNWRAGELTPSQKEEWARYNKSFIALAAIEWKILMDSFEEAKKFITNNSLLEIKYEDLCADPFNVIKTAIDFCNLNWSKEYENMVTKYKLKNANYKWQENLTDNQQTILEEILQHYLSRYDYL